MKLISAPIATISHAGFRCVVEKYGGADEYFSEMINAASLVNGGQFEKYYVETAPVPEKLVWQLVGKDANYLQEATCMVASIGGVGVDINMGCSAPEIIRAGAGIAWMSKPHSDVQKMIHGIKTSLPQDMRLSVKLRLGDDNFCDDDFFAFCDMLCDSGIELLTLHARTKKEKYRTHSRWQYVERLSNRVKNRGVEVYLNGDVSDASSFENAISVAPNICGVMIGRASVQKPWIFGQLKRSYKNISHSGAVAESGGKACNSCSGDSDNSSNLQIDLCECALFFVDMLEKYQPQEFWQSRWRRFFSYFCKNFSFAHYAEIQFFNAKDINDLRLRVKDYFEKVPDDKFLDATF